MNPKIKSGKKLFLGLSASVFGIYLLLSYLVNKDIFRSLDYEVMEGLQSLISRNVDLPFSLLTVIGSSEVTILILTVIFILVFIKGHNLFSGLVLFFMTFIIELAGKFYIYHPNPPTIFFRNVINLKLPSGFIVDTHFSYPSGHMARIAYIITILFIISLLSPLKKIKKTIILSGLLLFTFGTFISRIYLGEHWMSDVIGGSLLGMGLGFLSLAFW